MPKSALVFLIVGGLFALTHAFATLTSLYWYYPWFDIVMHFWGGVLIVLGVRALSRMDFPLQTNKRTIFGIALILMILWEVFERVIGLSVHDIYYLDTTKDIIVGSVGVIIGYLVLKTK